MSIFRWKKTAHEQEDDALKTAQNAVDKATRSVTEACERGKEVTEETRKLKRLSEKNNFAAMITKAMGGTAQ